ncbi:MAG: FkbM family methyltransferase [Gloeomargarita sp. SKYBB_i_bin120]|nr:FkbM family methyltransferase [Gloeomargarita sp. SKYB120]MDW8179135.1 FkbM family methyltransferase [Gloeomargarita sp. SKYBB_i_bin120]
MDAVNTNVRSMPLIMDIGMHEGEDTFFYLRKGFRVVAVEANPLLVSKVQTKLASYISTGQLTIEPIAIGPKDGEITFYVNLDNDQWSSLKREWGTRDGTRYQEISVPCRQPQYLFQKYGMPYYLKVDIEGNDIDVVRALHDFRERPRYISIEENQAYYFAELWSVGCRSFKLVDQRNLHKLKCPNPPLEGLYVDATFGSCSSGPFGEETPGEWLNFDLALETYFTTVRSPTKGYLAGYSWFDIHGRFE